MKRFPKIRCICVRCQKLRIVTPLYPTTREERRKLAAEYVCSDHDTAK